MEIPSNLLCLFSGEVEAEGDRYVIEIPESEISSGELTPNRVYRVAMIPNRSGDEDTQSLDPTRTTERATGESTPPVTEGDQRTVDIEAIGEKGDGIARVERGYVVIVPDTEEGERVTIEIEDVQENVAFAEVIGRKTHASSELS